MRRQNGFSGFNISQPVEFQGEERRNKARIYVPFPATVRGLLSGGNRFKINTHLQNLGARGLQLRMDQAPEPGTKIFLLVYFSATSSHNAPRVAILGTVQRVELQPDDTFGVAVAITHHRFL